MNSTTHRLTILNSVLIVSLIIMVLLNYFQDKEHQEIVYIDNVVLFNGFNMTKDIKKVEEAKINQQAKELDSIYVKLESISDVNDPLSKTLQQQIANKSKSLQELQDNYTQNLSQGIWNRINGYIKEYGETHDIKIILGTNGAGNVMFAKESIDITKDVLEFSNRKYEGNN